LRKTTPLEHFMNRINELNEKIYNRDPWHINYVDRSLLTILNNLEKIELELIAYELGIYHDYDITKEDLINILIEKLPIYVPLYLKNCDRSALYFIKRLLNNNGLIRYYENDHNLVLNLRYTGSFFLVLIDGKRYILMPEEIQTSLRTLIDASFEELINHNQFVVDYLYGLLNYYGVINYEYFVNSISQHLERQELNDTWYYQGIIHFQKKAHKRIETTNDKIILSKIIYKDLISLQDYYRSYNLKCKAITKEEILKLGKQRTTDTQTYKDLRKLFMEYFAIKSDDVGLVEVLSALTNKMKLGYTFIEYINYINQYFIFGKDDKDGTIDFLNKLVNIYFHAPMYALKGYSLNEAKDYPNVYIPQININNYLSKLRYGNDDIDDEDELED